jgi:Flp pilus assembly protein TadD
MKLKASLVLLLSFVLGAAAMQGAELGWVEDAVIAKAKRAVVTVERIGPGNDFPGFFASEDGLVVALATEIEGIKAVTIRTSAGEKISGSRLVALDRELDIAVFATGKRAPGWLAVAEKPASVGETCAVLFPLNGQILAADGVLLARRERLDRTYTRFRTEWSVALSPSSAARSSSPVITGDGQVAGILSAFRLKGGRPPQRFAFAHPETAIASVLARAREAKAALEFPPVSSSAHDTLAAADPDFIAGLKFTTAGDAARAVQKFRSVHAKHPQSPQVLEHLAGALFAMEDKAGARATMEEAMRMAPERLNLRIMLGSIMGSQGDIAKTTAHFEAMTAEFPNYGEAWEGLGNCYMHAGRKDEAVAAYRKWIEFEPDSILARQSYRGSLASAGKVSEAGKASEWADELESVYFKLKYSAPHRD